MDDCTLPSTTWDIIVLGTGVKPSLLSVALSRAGKKVLQLDPREYYGATETAFSIDELEQWAKSPLPPFSHIETERLAEITRPRGYTLALAPHLVYWGSSLLELLREVEMTSSFTWQAVGSWWVYIPDSAMEERPATGIGGLLLDAGVKAVKATAAVKKKGGWNKGRKKSKDIDTEASTAASEVSAPTTDAEVTPADLTPEATSTAPAGSTLRKLGSLREVPCTFEDVAFSPDLQDRDRGYLGGFLRFLMKCADPADVKHQEILQKNAETSFSEFLSSEYPLPTWTIASLHSLTLLQTAPNETKLKDAVPALITHMTSIGSIPDIRSSAALTIAYGGSAELTQVWSRGTAVSGGLNVLGRGITKIVGDTVTLSNGEVVTAEWIIIPDEEEFETSETQETPETESTTETTTKSTKSTTSYTKSIHLISSPLDSLFTRKLETDRIPPNAAVLTFPVGSLSTSTGITNTAPVYIIAHSSATGECGKDESVLYTSTQISKDDGGYELSSIAVKRVLEEIGSDGTAAVPEVKFVCRYTQEFPVDDKETPAGEKEGEVKGRVVKIKGMKDGLAFDEGTVESCKRVYERIIGTREGFLRMTETMRRQYEEMEDQ
ncbi:GDP dissociation inhibitor-domain-containing protein [Pyronema omphalodes]|nr:GDP dissociation inhibitor-domain-containing protein [Pyronema omphalodes]